MTGAPGSVLGPGAQAKRPAAKTPEILQASMCKSLTHAQTTWNPACATLAIRVKEQHAYMVMDV